MRTFFIKSSSILLFLLLNACNFPTQEPPSPTFTVDPETAPAIETETPQTLNYSECGFVWARKPLPDLSKDFKNALKEIQPQADGHAEAYGENCINHDGEVVRFLAMETDFYITLQVKDLEDKQALGELVEQVLDVVGKFPPEETPGPQPGYVGITFEAPGDELRLWFTIVTAKTALESGLEGEDLFVKLQEK
jgi:hypothetical protein